MKWLSGCRGQYRAAGLRWEHTQVTRCAGPSRRCSPRGGPGSCLAVYLCSRIGIGASIGRSHHQTDNCEVSTCRSGPGRVHFVAYTWGEDCKRRDAHHPLFFPTNYLLKTPEAVQVHSGRAVPALLPNWETGEAHQDARDEPTWTPCLLFWSVVNVSTTE